MDFITYLVYKDHIPFQIGLTLLRSRITGELSGQTADQLILQQILTRTQLTQYRSDWLKEEPEGRLQSSSPPGH